MKIIPKCPKCGSALPRREPGPGRPSRYCSVGCRRSAEFEIRRIDRAIEKVEDRLRLIRTSDMPEVGRREGLAKYEAELAQLEARFRELLDDVEPSRPAE